MSDRPHKIENGIIDADGKDITGYDPVGAVLSMGMKNTSGQIDPFSKGLFWFLNAKPDEKNVRQEHPHFRIFNSLSRIGYDHAQLKREARKSNDPALQKRLAELELKLKDVEYAKTINAIIGHPRRDDFFEYHRKAPMLKGHPAHPRNMPVCYGNGIKANRWDGTQYREIVCPGENCEFAKAQVKGKTPDCKPWFRLLFQPEWRDDKLPQVLTKLTSAGWGSLRSLKGLLDNVARAAQNLNIPPERWSYMGFRFSMTIRMVSKKPEPWEKFPRSWPEVSFAPIGSIELWLFEQMRRQQEYGLEDQSQKRLQLESLQDRSQLDEDVVLADYETITPSKRYPD